VETPERCSTVVGPSRAVLARDSRFSGPSGSGGRGCASDRDICKPVALDLHCRHLGDSRFARWQPHLVRHRAKRRRGGLGKAHQLTPRKAPTCLVRALRTRDSFHPGPFSPSHAHENPGFLCRRIGSALVLLQWGGACREDDSIFRACLSRFALRTRDIPVSCLARDRCRCGRDRIGSCGYRYLANCRAEASSTIKSAFVSGAYLSRSHTEALA